MLKSKVKTISTLTMTCICLLLVILSQTAAAYEIIAAGGGIPRGMALSQDAQRLYVGVADYVNLIDLNDGEIINSVLVGYDPLDIRITQDWQYLYVANTVNGYYTSKINLASNEVVATIHGGTDPAWLAITPDGSTLCVGSHWTGALQLIDVESDAQIGWIGGISNGSFGLVVTDDGRFVYVLARCGGPGPGTGLYKVSLETSSIESVIPISGGEGIAMTSDGDELWIPGYDLSSKVYIVSTITDQMIDSVAVGSSTFDITITNDQRYAAVSCTDSKSVDLISVDSRSVIGSVSLPKTPTRIIWAPDGRKIYVAIPAMEAIGVIDISEFGLSVAVPFDIKPGSCPNPLNVSTQGLDFIPWGGYEESTDADIVRDAVAKPRPEFPTRGKAVLPAAILGTADFDVTMIDPSTIGIVDDIAPIRWSYEDVATPVGEDAEDCACNDMGPDGYMDLTLKFDRNAVIAALGELTDGATIPVTIVGQLTDGTPFEGTDCIWIIDNGQAAMASGDDADESDADLSNYPNPFNPSTTISFRLVQPTYVRLDVFNITGQKVRALADDDYPTGEHSVVWDGKDSAGHPVSSGIYFYRLIAGDITETKQMILLK